MNKKNDFVVNFLIGYFVIAPCIRLIKKLFLKKV